MSVETSDMNDVIEKLLILQDRDQKLRRVNGELSHIEPERQSLRTKAADAQGIVEKIKSRLKQNEADRKNLQLEVETKKELIAKYSLQQFQTRKNEEYRALAHEIELCKEAITQTEDRELELMEEAETGQKDLARATQELNGMKKLVEDQLSQLAAREQSLTRELAELQANREELASAAGGGARSRYERLLKNKGERVVVGVEHGVCGGCHMRLPPQLLVMCQADNEIVTCSNCGRILYYTRDMDLAIVE